MNKMKFNRILKYTLLLLAMGVSSISIAQTSAGVKGIRLINAYDAFGKQNPSLTQDFGFSCVVEYNGKIILFDAGTNTQLFEQNVKALKIDLRKIDVAVLSHGHYDHMGGLDYLISVNPNVKIYLPYDFFSLGAPTKFPFKEDEPAIAKTLGKDEQYFRGEKVIEGMVTVPTGRFSKGNVEYLREAKEVLPGLQLVPTTSTLMGTYIKYPPFEDNPQLIGMPELSASFQTESGQVIIAGCSHSTIESIIQAVVKVNNSKIYLVGGGFHLIPYKRDYIEGLAQRMKDVYKVKQVAPAHCTGHLGFSVFQKIFGDGYKFFGLGETIDL
ncbi:MBL fold metallo-hydrolase [Chryseolinea sp. H1M3-3]|uniref:MBL fold metallo-hydrolase n=1 Tax=Chryseolinea sp. H1M3-3 TaxID=3034144 RepID=UPI0023EC9524|nr:MBL fold metallo-hydrolase [Chryseolinea sp. H1M3-3]